MYHCYPVTSAPVFFGNCHFCCQSDFTYYVPFLHNMFAVIIQAGFKWIALYLKQTDLLIIWYYLWLAVYFCGLFTALMLLPKQSGLARGHWFAVAKSDRICLSILRDTGHSV